MKKAHDTAAQRAAMMDYLAEHGRMTTLQARAELGIMHPAGRVRELREQGINIVTAWKTENDTSGRPHRQALYLLCMEGQK
jgi:aspartate carbamoyltransferase catalytic subunit